MINCSVYFLKKRHFLKKMTEKPIYFSGVLWYNQVGWMVFDKIDKNRPFILFKNNKEE